LNIQGLQEENRKTWKEIQKLNVAFSSYTSRGGHYIEKTIMELYKEALEIHGIDPSKVKHGYIEDKLGVVSRGRKYEVDFYETNDHIYLFEIKNLADEGAIEQLETREKISVSLYNKPVKKSLVTNSTEKEIKGQAENSGIIVVAGIVVE